MAGGTVLKSSSNTVAQDETKRGGILDVGLLSYFALWYLGNYYYNITNKLALKAAGGATGFPMTLACLQLGVGVVYAAFLWAAPDSRSLPKVVTSFYMIVCLIIADISGFKKLRCIR